MEIEIRWHFRNFTQLMEPTFCVLSNPCQPTPQQLSSLSLPDLFFALFFDFLCSSSSQATHHNFVSPLRLLPFFYSLFSFLFMLGLGLVSLFFPPSFISFSYWVSGFGFYFIFLFSFLSFLHWVSRWMRMKAMIASGFGERR